MVNRSKYVLGIGVDVLRMTRFHQILLNRNENYIQRLSARILHEDQELPTFQKLFQENKIEQCSKYISGSWASKEALFKTLDLEDQKNFIFHNWYRYYDNNGKPQIRSNKYSKVDEEFLLSISHDGDILVANVLRQTAR